jgi:fatty acid desaturase
MTTAMNEPLGSVKDEHPTSFENPLQRLSAEQIEAIGNELDALYDEVKQSLGDRDAAYIRSVIGLQRRLALVGRALLVGTRYRLPWVAGAGLLGLAKILENMEIGHNVLHGQWDWMNDPVINSRTWDWDTASTAEAWRHSHNFIHHTYTNIRGLDKDLGYEIMRIDPHQRWHPVYLLQPVYNLLLMALFEWGVAVHDMDIEAVLKREKPTAETWDDLKGISEKAWLQIRKDYLAWPALSGLVAAGVAYSLGLRVVETHLDSRASTRQPSMTPTQGRRRRRAFGSKTDPVARALSVGCETYKRTLCANATANIIRNVWSYAIIFCGHFPDQTYTFTQEETEDESRGAWYVRQLLGAANIDGGPIFHVISGNLGYQVEHHLYPDMPSTRYGEIAPKVREICQRYELPYNTGPLRQQLGMVQRSILRLAFPGGKPRSKPAPYRGVEIRVEPERQLHSLAGATRAPR